ncbi:hypothetical protein ACJJTC_002318 [Scirpophaga incertulas]
MSFTRFPSDRLCKRFDMNLKPSTDAKRSPHPIYSDTPSQQQFRKLSIKIEDSPDGPLEKLLVLFRTNVGRGKMEKKAAGAPARETQQNEEINEIGGTRRDNLIVSETGSFFP